MSNNYSRTFMRDGRQQMDKEIAYIKAIYTYILRWKIGIVKYEHFALDCNLDGTLKSGADNSDIALTEKNNSNRDTSDNRNSYRKGNNPGFFI